MKIPIDIKSGEIKQSNDTTQNIIVGIDLGTTNSLISYIDKEGNAIALKGVDNKSTLVPSVIYFDKENRPVVGDLAKTKLIDEPHRTIFSIKRLLGRSYQDVVADQQQLGYEIVANDDAEELVKIKVGNTYFTPIELSAMILKALKERAEHILNQEVRQCVITVPAYFNDSQRQATRDAGKLAGLDVLRIVNEPTAASLAYGIGLDRSESYKVAVYDLGGGTFDISILQLEDGIYEILSTHGDTHLGGDDFDNRIVDHWLNALQVDQQNIRKDKQLVQLLRTKAEAAKKILSSQDHFSYNSELGFLEIDASTFQEITKDLVQQTIESCKHALKDASLTSQDIDIVVLVGGSTRMPIVKHAVEAFFGKEAKDDLNPDEIVAQGAAIQADILAGNRKDLLLLDITPLSLGIETVGGLMDTIIGRNTKIPTKAGRQYTTSVDGQKHLKISVYQGERELVAHNRKLGAFILKDIPPMPSGLPKIDISFILDADGILTVKAKELRSSVEASVEIKSTYGISEEEMAKMLLESIKNAKTDIDTRALIEAQNEAQNIILSTKKFLKQNDAILTNEEKQKLTSLMEEMQSLVAQGTKDQIQLAMDALNKFATPLAHRALDHNIGLSMKGKKI